MYFQKIWRSAQYTSLNLFRGVMCIFRSFGVLEDFEKCTKDSSRQRDQRAYRIIKYFLVRILLRITNFGQIGKIGQIVSQIFENFRMILTISTLNLYAAFCNISIKFNLIFKPTLLLLGHFICHPMSYKSHAYWVVSVAMTAPFSKYVRHKEKA